MSRGEEKAKQWTTIYWAVCGLVLAAWVMGLATKVMVPADLIWCALAIAGWALLDRLVRYVLRDDKKP
jgi:hypothetical protein